MKIYLCLGVSLSVNIFLSLCIATFVKDSRDKSAVLSQENIRLADNNKYLKQEVARLEELLKFHKQLNGVQ